MRCAVVIAVLTTLAACTTAPDLLGPDLSAPDLSGPNRGTTDIPDSPWFTETFLSGVSADRGEVSIPQVPVTAVILDPPPRSEAVVLAGVGAGGGASGRDTAGARRGGAGGDRSFPGLSVGTTPWQRSLTGRQPVGVVIQSGRVLSAPVPPYWAVVLSSQGTWQMVAQRELQPSFHQREPLQRAEAGERSNLARAVGGVVPEEIALGVGGFYPLIAGGRVVADEFPGASIRAPRVAIGGRAGDDPRLVIVATGTGTSTGCGVAADGEEARHGLTTAELARVLQRYELEWALNLDGGRSAYLHFPDGSLRPRGVWLRRRGPVVLRITLPERSQPPRRMVE